MFGVQDKGGFGQDAKASSGFSFGVGSTQSAAAPSFSFGGATPASGFSFGGDSKSNDVKPVASSGFSFGGAAKAEESNPVVSSGFSFGGASPVADTKSAAGFSFGGGNELSKSDAKPGFSTLSTLTEESKNGSNALVLSSTPSDGPAKLQLNGSSIEGIVTEWNQILQSDIDAFAKAAEQVKRRDYLLLENQKRITELAKEAQILKQNYDGLKSDLFSVSELQVDLHASLENLERELDNLESSTAGNAHEHADLQRQEAYQRSAELENQLNVMSGQMKDVVERLNKNYPSSTDKESCESIAFQILNKHYLSLEWLEKSSMQLTHEITNTSRQIQRAQANSQARFTY